MRPGMNICSKGNCRSMLLSTLDHTRTDPKQAPEAPKLIAQEVDATGLAAMLERSLELLVALQPGVEPFLSKPGSAGQVQISCLSNGQPSHPAPSPSTLVTAKTLGLAVVLRACSRTGLPA